MNIDLVLFLRFENTQKENLANMDLSCPHARFNNVLEESMLHGNLHKGLKSTTWNWSAV